MTGVLSVDYYYITTDNGLLCIRKAPIACSNMELFISRSMLELSKSKMSSFLSVISFVKKIWYIYSKSNYPLISSNAYNLPIFSLFCRIL